LEAPRTFQRYRAVPFREAVRPPRVDGRDTLLPRVFAAVLRRVPDALARPLLADRTVARDDADFFAGRAGFFARAGAVLPALAETGFFLAPGPRRRADPV
jgi:hypothetical protein